MADYIPFHVQAEIIKRLPIISLLQFRSVSKAWKSLIDSSNFIAAHSVTQPQHLLFWYEYQVEIKEDPEDPVEIRDEFVSFLDDDTFPKQRFVHTLPQSFKRLYHPSIVGSSFGLLCFCGHLTMGDVFGPKFEMIVLWNPSIRKSISVAVPNKINHDHNYGLGFGVCPVTRDPKIVRITQFNNSSYHCEAKVYTVSSGKWRSLSSNLPRKQLWIQSQSQAVDKFIYWCAFDLTTEENGLPNHNLIMSFDTTNENFGEIDLPDKLKHHLSTDLSISKIRVSLVMLEYNNIVIETWSIWIMENGVQKSFTKLYTVEAPYGLRTLTPLGFRNSGQPILEAEKDHEFMFAGDELVAYEPNTKRFDYLEIYGTNGTFVLNSYMETLLLLGRSDYNIVVDDDGQEHMITFGPDGSGMCFKLC